MSEFTSSRQLGSGWAVLTQGIGSAPGSTSLDRPQAGSTVIVWFDRESHSSLGSKHEPLLTLVCISHPSSFPSIHMMLLDLPAVMTI